MRKDERVNDFFDRFDTIVREYETCEGAIPLTTEEIRSAFYQAVAQIFPELRNTNFLKRQSSSQEMTLEEIKTFMLQLEAEKKSDREEHKVHRVQSEEARSNKDRCFRCNKDGHWSGECPLKSQNKWFCYVCQAIRNHKGDQCTNGTSSRESKRYVINHNKYKFKGKGSKDNYKKPGTKSNVNKKFNKNKNEQKGVSKNTNKKREEKNLESEKGRARRVRENQEDEENESGKSYISFIADSGATDHIIYNAMILSNFSKCENKIIKSANKNEIADIEIDGRGDLLLYTGLLKDRYIKLSNVFATKDVSENLLSLRKLADSGLSIYLDNETLRVYDKITKRIILEGIYEKPNWVIKLRVRRSEQDNNNKEVEYDVYCCRAKMVRDNSEIPEQSQTINTDKNSLDWEGDLDEMEDIDAAIGRENEENLKTKEDKSEIEDQEFNSSIRDSVKIDDLEAVQGIEEMFTTNPLRDNRVELEKLDEGMLWHIRLGHASINYLKKLQKINKELEKVKFNDSILQCEICIMSKMQKQPFKEVRRRAERPLQIIHTDTMGPIKPTSHPGRKRFINVYIDDYSRLARAYPIKTKDESGEALEKFLISTRNLIGEDAKVCYIRADQGTEFTGEKFLDVLEREKIKRFGCIGYIKIPKPNLKFGERAIKAVFVGYKSSGYLLWHPSSGKFLESRHVKFNEKLVYKDVYKNNQLEEIKNTEYTKEGTTDWNWMKEFEEEIIEKIEKPEPKKRGRPRKKSKELDETNRRKRVEEGQKPNTRSTTKRKLESEEKNESQGTRRLIEDISYINYANTLEDTVRENSRGKTNKNEEELRQCLIASLYKEPVSYEEAMKTRDRSNWKRAIKDEIESMIENKVWSLIDRAKINIQNKKPNIIDSKWVFKRKREADGSTRFKARLVIRGFKDRNSYNLMETYAPVSRLPVIRAVLAIINKYELHACQLDVKTAFLNGILEEEIYMEIPNGLEVDENMKRTKVCKLEKALYGLKVSPKKWNKRFTEEIIKIGLENDLHEPCLYTWRKNNKMAVLVIYVDDILVASNDIKKLENIKEHLSKVFEMKDLGEPKSFLGMEIIRNKEEKSLTINQSKYTESILEKFNMKECKPQTTPMVTRQVENRNKRKRIEDLELETEAQVREFKRIPFREAIGSLMYLANGTRPDIAFAVNYLARKQVEPTEDDWSDVKRVFRYLRGTANYGLEYVGTSENLEAYTDASFRDIGDSSSTGGYLIKLFGDVIAWRSHKQSYVTLSTCQAEYLAMSDASQELISLDKGIRFIIGKSLFPATIWCDNRSAGSCTEKDGSHKLKMFDDNLEEINKSLQEREKSGIRKHMAQTHGDFVKQCVRENRVRVKWVNTKENIADILTKPLPLDAHKYLRDKMVK